MKTKKYFLFIAIMWFSANSLMIYAQDAEEKLDLAYKYLNTGNTNDAIRIFENYLKTHPGDLNIYLQLAYAYKQIGKIEDAKDNFTYVVFNSNDISQINKAKEELKLITNKNNVNQLTTSGDDEELNKGYSFINKGDINSAIGLFEKYKLSHPSNTKISLQLGYLYNDKKDYTKALDEFEFVYSKSKNRDEIDKAAQSKFYLKDMIINLSKRSTDIYFYNMYDSYQDNYISNFIGHINFKLWKNAFIGPYADAYLDAKSKTGNILNDRYVEGGGFFKYRFTDFIGFEFRAGYVNEIDYNKSSFNYKPILSMGTRFGNPSPYLSQKNTKNSYLYFDIFSTGLYDYKFRNLFGQLQLKEVFRYLTGGFSYMEFYLSQMTLADSKKLDYNNYLEVGSGISFKPNLINFPTLFLEATNKTFFIGPEGKYFNGSLKNTFQVKAGFLINLKTLL
jgi:outer membrane protein assembly factor BamD (BamD/ComL family)